MDCSDGICGKCRGGKKLVLGAILLLNVWVWPKWLGVDGWLTLLGVLLVIGGVVKLAKPNCGHSDVSPAPVSKKGKKKK